MRQTPNYSLPQFDGVDFFNKEALNDAFEKIDRGINDMQEAINLVPNNAGVLAKEVVDARKGKLNLKEKIEDIDSNITENINQLGIVDNKKRDKLIPIYEEDLSQSLKEKLTNGNVAVIGNGVVSDVNLNSIIRKSLTEDYNVDYTENVGMVNGGGTYIAYDSNPNYVYYEVNVKEYDLLHCASAVDRTSAYQICFADSNGLILEKYNSAVSLTFIDDKYYVVPKNTAKCYLNVHKGNSLNLSKTYIKKRLTKDISKELVLQNDKINLNLNNINFITKTINELTENRYFTKVNVSWETGYWKSDGAVGKNNITAHSLYPIVLLKGDELTINSDEIFIDVLDENKTLLQSGMSMGSTFKPIADTKIYLNFKFKDLRIITDLTVINSTINYKLFLGTKTENEVKDNYWNGKTIIWYGTSIPEGSNSATKSYPLLIGDMLGATVINKSVGGSKVSAGTLNSFCSTLAEKQLMAEWTTATDSERTKWTRSCYDQCLDPYLTDSTLPDLFVFDYGYNDWDNTNNSELPSNLYDKTTLIGGMNFIINRILSKYPNTRICIIGHYAKDMKQIGVTTAKYICECQEKISELWNLPIFKTWEKMGWSQMPITTTGYWNTNNIWVNSGGAEQTLPIINTYMKDKLHPHSDYSGDAIKLYANVLYPFIRDVK